MRLAMIAVIVTFDGAVGKVSFTSGSIKFSKLVYINRFIRTRISSIVEPIVTGIRSRAFVVLWGWKTGLGVIG